mmetsp:Transcript_29605/g.55019  ORF Transcript_29605/g.55019 Transcript_29605/m.55019 type:complete len:228 (+) Transcript_29605:86-769(+)
MEARLKFRTVGAGALGSVPNSSAPPSRIATLMHSLSSMVHLSRLSRFSLPYLAMHPVMHALSPRHLAVHVRPFRQDGSSARHALAWREQRSTRHVWSTREESKPLPPYLADNSFSARAASGVRRTDADRAATARAEPTRREAFSRRAEGFHSCCEEEDSPSRAKSNRERPRLRPTTPPSNAEYSEAKCAGRRAEGEKASVVADAAARATAMAATLRLGPGRVFFFCC